MRIIITILCVFTLSWLYVGAPTSVKKMFGEIRPLQNKAVTTSKTAYEIPNTRLSGKTLVETMQIRKHQAEDRKEKALSGEIYGNKEWAEIHGRVVSRFANLKNNPCNKELIKAFAESVGDYFVYARQHADDGTLKPVDYDLKDKAADAISDAAYGKYLVRSDLSKRALKIFSWQNKEREACKLYE